MIKADIPEDILKTMSVSAMKDRGMCFMDDRLADKKAKILEAKQAQCMTEPKSLEYYKTKAADTKVKNDLTWRNENDQTRAERSKDLLCLASLTILEGI